MDQKFYFKNAHVAFLPNVPFFSLIANFHSCDSVDFLTLDRGEFKDSMKSEAQILLFQAIDNYLHSSSFTPVYYKGINSFVLFMRLLGEASIPRLEKDWDFKFKGRPVHEYLSYQKVIVTTTFAQSNDVEIKEIGNDLLLSIDVIFMASSEEIIRAFLKILSDHYRNCYLKRVFVENKFKCVQYVMQNEDESDDDIGDQNEILPFVLDMLRRRDHFAILPYIKGFRHLRIPTDKAQDKVVDSSIVTMLPRKKMVKMISPFKYDGNKLIDNRCQELYDFVHECNGSCINEIKEDYARFVQVIITYWNKKAGTIVDEVVIEPSS